MSGSPEPGATLGPRHYLAMLADCPYLFVGDAGSRGLGVFTARPIRAGGVIVADEDGSMRGRALSLAAALAQGWDRQRHLFQLDYNLFLPPRGCFDDLFNHSCQPKAAKSSIARPSVERQIQTVARRNSGAGSQAAATSQRRISDAML